MTTGSHRTSATIDLWLLVVTLLALGACTTGSGSQRASPAVVLQPAGRPPVKVRVEVAARQQERARGLMFRQHLPADRGMLFVYPAEGRHAFWMKNTYISLDMIFIGANHRVVELVTDTTPLSTDHLGGQVPSQYVLEVVAGFVHRHGIRLGCPISFEGLDGYF